MNLNDNDFTYANLVLLQIRRILDNMLYNRELSDAEIISIALDVFRIFMEISSGVPHMTDDIEREWNLYLQAEKDEKDLKAFIHELNMNSNDKNQLLNAILSNENYLDYLKELIKKVNKQ